MVLKLLLIGLLGPVFAEKLARKIRTDGLIIPYLPPNPNANLHRDLEDTGFGRYCKNWPLPRKNEKSFSGPFLVLRGWRGNSVGPHEARICEKLFWGTGRPPKQLNSHGQKARELWTPKRDNRHREMSIRAELHACWKSTF